MMAAFPAVLAALAVADTSGSTTPDAALVSFKSIMAPLALALGASLVIERVLEFVKNLLEPWVRRQVTRAAPRAETADRSITDLETLQKHHTDDENVELPERHSNAVILVEKATDPDDGWTMRAFVLQALGLAIGILFAHFQKIQLFHALLVVPQILVSEGSVSFPVWADYMLTGLLIGGGSAPIHVLIKFITERKVPAALEAAPVEAKPAPAPAPPAALRAMGPAIVVPAVSAVAASQWVDIPYDGGVDREKLESTHRRSADARRIVYHHTAMSSRRTFDDVVREIKARQFITGYHCVIHASGTIHPFCRWDRYGTHALGHNVDTLGISLIGNFETTPGVPLSNADGRYGAPEPTDAQLNSAARVVALWTSLYNIPVDFDDRIVPHKKIRATSCPGNRFPYDRFKSLVDVYRGRWEKSAEVQDRIAAFRLKPYLYVRGAH